MMQNITMHDKEKYVESLKWIEINEELLDHKKVD